MAGLLTATLVSSSHREPCTVQANMSLLAVDVNIYASSPKDAWPLVGNHENTEIGHFLAGYLDLDVDAVTKRLQSSAYWTTSGEELTDQEKYGWLGDPLGADVRTEGLDTYHGDFRKRSLGECGCGTVH